MDYNNKIDITKQRSYAVVKSNDIIRKARYDLTISELKTLAFIFSKIKPTDTSIQDYSFSIKEYCQVIGIDYKNGKNYIDVKKNIKALRDKSFWLLDENNHEVLVGWLSKARINKGSGKIIVRLDDEIQKYVIGLFDNYTQYELLSTLPMKSSYSFKLFELLKSYAFTKSHTFDIDDLKGLLSAAHYTNFKDFRRYVLEVATKEINLYTDIEISWEPVKQGKKVIKVKFDIIQRDTWARFAAATAASKQLEGQISLFDYDYYK